MRLEPGSVLATLNKLGIDPKTESSVVRNRAINILLAACAPIVISKLFVLIAIYVRAKPATI